MNAGIAYPLKTVTRVMGWWLYKEIGRDAFGKLRQELPFSVEKLMSV